MKSYKWKIVKDVYLFSLLVTCVLVILQMITAIACYQFTHYIYPAAPIWWLGYLVFIPIIATVVYLVRKNYEVEGLVGSTAIGYDAIAYAMLILKWNTDEIKAPSFAAKISAYVREFEM